MYVNFNFTVPKSSRPQITTSLKHSGQLKPCHPKLQKDLRPPGRTENDGNSVNLGGPGCDGPPPPPPPRRRPGRISLSLWQPRQYTHLSIQLIYVARAWLALPGCLRESCRVWARASIRLTDNPTGFSAAKSRWIGSC